MPEFSSIDFVLKILDAAPTLRALLDEAKGKPSAEDSKIAAAYRQRLDERRVFTAEFHSEVVESCLGSLREIREFTDTDLAKLSHPSLRAVLGAMLDNLRTFLDKWHDYRTPPTERWRGHRPRFDEAPDEDLSSFFKDLGSLRERTALLVGCIDEIVPRPKSAKRKS